ncbi:MAG: phosphatase PAP2 family protein [candidate division WOR-3 bacterium]|nr:phosphatase PAP2 family protein [candidate division WOR-3 bacterium]
MKIKHILGLFFLYCVLSWLNPVTANIDQSIYHTIHHDWQSNTMDKIMQTTEHLSGATALSLANLSVVYFGGERECQNAKLAITAWTGAFTTTLLLKGIINRERPEGQQTSRWNSSFPSGHTANYFSLATVYSAKYPKLAIPLYGFGVLVGLSRIYLGEHYPSDVLAGAAIGIGFGYLTLKLEKQISKLPFF